MTSKWPVRPYRSMTSRTDRRPSLQRVWTWKSHSRNGSYPGTLHPHVEMLAVGRPMPQNLGPEVSNVQRKHLALPHGLVAPRGRPDPALRTHAHASERRKATAEIGVLSVE